MLALSVYILIFAVPGFAFLKFQMVSTAMQVPMQYIYFSQVLMFGFLSLSCIFRIILMIADWNKSPMTEEEKLQAMKEEAGIA
jgi:cytochrome b subunit of formate dehydrogenase